MSLIMKRMGFNVVESADGWLEASKKDCGLVLGFKTEVASLLVANLLFKAHLTTLIPQHNLARVLYECNRYNSSRFMPFAVHLEISSSGTGRVGLAGKSRGGVLDYLSRVPFYIEEAELFHNQFSKHLQIEGARR
jgi:hypothetical protein